MSKRLLGILTVSLVALPARADQVFPDDAIVQGSLCTGLDCVNNESFGFDTIRLKENNLRIKFEDTSASASFPTADWTLIANDSGSGGVDYFAIEEASGARVPFKVRGGAPTDSLFVAPTGFLGLRTNNPGKNIHANYTDTPGIRLEQNSSGGYSPQTWDIAGNEANFFIRDLTNGSLLPFRIRPGAPTSSIDIANTGFVGINKAGPSARLHIAHGGAVSVKYEDTVAASVWTSTHGPDALVPGGRVWTLAEGANPDAIAVTHDGNVRIAGTLASGSSRSIKKNIVPVTNERVLQGVRALPIAEWQYKNDAAKHVGPMAEDFYQAFGLGTDDKHIAPADLAGVALASTKALTQTVDTLRAENAELKRRLERLERALVENRR